MARLAPREYEFLLDLASDVLRGRGPEQPWRQMMGELRRALHTSTVVLTEATWHRREGRAHAWSGERLTARRLAELSPLMVRAGHPLARHYSTHRDDEPRTAADLVGEAAWRDSEARSLTREFLGAEHAMGIPLHWAAGTARGFVVYHAEGDFCATERLYARRAQPLLAGLDTHLRLVARWRTTVADGEERAEERRLTPRETTVLLLLAESLSAVAIGRRLGISPRTVQKHVQRIYRKLGVTDRVGAVLRAQATGLLSAPRVQVGAGSTHIGDQ